jgi:beta-lactamase domain protein
MFYSIAVTDGVTWVGLNDRTSQFFERLWPLPYGVSYNSYLVVGEKSALIDTVLKPGDATYLDRIMELTAGRPLDYLVVNHMEPDHSGAIDMIVARCPQITIVGNKQTKKLLDTMVPGCPNFLEVSEGQEIDLGGGKHLRFVLTPWVHWPETMMTYIPEQQVLFSGDAFGSFGAHDGYLFDDEFNYASIEDEMRRYFSCIVGRYSGFVQKALAKLKGIPIKYICSTHGPVWRKHTNWVVGRYDAWSRQVAEPGVVVAVASMYGTTMNLAEYVARQLVENGIRDVEFFDVSVTSISNIVSQAWRLKGLILVSVSYNTGLYPAMQLLCDELLQVKLADRYLGVLGTGSWCGGAMRKLTEFAKESGLPLASEPVEVLGQPTPEKLKAMANMARAVAVKVLADARDAK